MQNYNQTLRWIGTTLIVSSGIAVSVSLTQAILPWAYIGFLVGHGIWAVQALLMKEQSLFALNVFLGLIDTYAVVIRL